jgi:tRNA (cmo5U34)-methyltransferase
VGLTWKDQAKVDEYVGRVGRLEARAAGEQALIEALPDHVDRVLDLGCGDGRLLQLVIDARPHVIGGVGVDNSPPMLELANQRFDGDRRVELLEQDLTRPLPALEPFDVIVSGFAIHHLAHDRKQALFAEIASVLRPGGVFANLEVVMCATPELQAEFLVRIGRPGGDPQDVLATVEEQLGWMRAASLTQVDCFWRWRGFSLLVGSAPATR